MKRMGLSMYCVDFNGYDQMLEILDACKFAKLGVELSMFSRTNTAWPGFMEQLALERDRFAPYYITFHGPYAEVEATSPLDSEAHKIMIEAYRQAFDFYQDFHANGIVMHTNQRIQLTEDNSQLKNNCIETILEIAQMAREKGVELYVENVGISLKENVLFPYEDFIALFDELPEDIGCLVDVGHAFDNGWDVPALVERLGTRIKAYHLHNNDGIHDSHRPSFEEGAYYSMDDWKKLVYTMEKYTPDADWIVEYSPGEHITTQLIVDDVKMFLKLREEADAQLAMELGTADSI